MREIREALQMNGEAFATALRQRAQVLGFAVGWDRAKVSKAENGVRDLSIEDVTVLATLDPVRRGWNWVAFGENPKTAAAELEPANSEERVTRAGVKKAAAAKKRRGA